jgi:predicted DNA-binding protein (UPF0251 family)
MTRLRETPRLACPDDAETFAAVEYLAEHLSLAHGEDPMMAMDRALEIERGHVIFLDNGGAVKPADASPSPTSAPAARTRGKGQHVRTKVELDMAKVDAWVFKGMSHKEIAAKLGVSPATVGRRLQEAAGETSRKTPKAVKPKAVTLRTTGEAINAAVSALPANGGTVVVANGGTIAVPTLAREDVQQARDRLVAEQVTLGRRIDLLDKLLETW